jgi:hypothetical protein
LLFSVETIQSFQSSGNTYFPPIAANSRRLKPIERRANFISQLRTIRSAISHRSPPIRAA